MINRLERSGIIRKGNMDAEVSSEVSSAKKLSVKKKSSFMRRLSERKPKIETFGSLHLQTTILFKPNADSCAYLLNPHSEFLKYWDVLAALLLLYTALITPFEVAFLESQRDALFYFNRFVDSCFFCDLCFQFFLPYREPDGSWIVEQNKIAFNYSTSWFTLDLVSTIPFDVLTDDSVTGGADGLANMQIIRLIRILRLIKLLRVMRSGRMFQRWESRFAIDYSVLSLQKFILIVLLMAHWMACAWRMVAGKVEEGSTAVNWTSYYTDRLNNDDTAALYIASLYWAVATLSTLGYGDILPTNDLERIMVVCSTVVGASVYAYMVGAVCGIVAQMDEEKNEFYKRMDNLNYFMRDKNFPPNLQERLRDFFRFRRANSGMQDNTALLEAMSPLLRGEVAECVHKRWIEQIPFFKFNDNGADQLEFFTSLALLLRTEIRTANEQIIRLGSRATSMYIIEKGLIGCNGRLHSSGSTFGVDMLQGIEFRDYTAWTLSQVVLLVLERGHLEQVIAQFPVVERMLKLSVVRHTCMENIKKYSIAVRYFANELFDQYYVLQSLGIQYLEGRFPVRQNSVMGASLSSHDHESRRKIYLWVLSIEPLKTDFLAHTTALIKLPELTFIIQCVTRIQLVYRHWVHKTTRKKYYKRLYNVDKMPTKQAKLFDLLENLGFLEHWRGITKQNLDYNNIAFVTAGDLHTAIGMPLGDAVLLLQSVNIMKGNIHLGIKDVATIAMRSKGVCEPDANFQFPLSNIKSPSPQGKTTAGNGRAPWREGAMESGNQLESGNQRPSLGRLNSHVLNDAF
ncbi:hypothetical protein CYMTET_4363 [Cymbomonas tetramitiformis]|uniref:Cyclic nucleotide-binding domain-containing protein n=1 Tax=Cymbomonas tetramitiformis TaxID=36881 RepID=A0AAE0LK60_9CHLO|nr:hypothetical protein CYMTET_4363 [Cymbomonas tetramitiformis]